MKILFICNEYPPMLHGGIGSFSRDIAQGLTNAGHSVVVFGLYAGIKEDMIEDINGVTVYRIKFDPIRSRFNHIWFVFCLNQNLKSFLKTRLFDIIECQEWQGLLPCGIRHPNYVIRLHGAAIYFDKLLGRKGNRLVHILEKLTIKNGKHIVAVSFFCGKRTLQLTKSNRTFTVIYNAIDINRIRKYKVDTYNKYSIVFANSLLPKKGIFELADAFNIIIEKYPDASLTYIGKTTYSDEGINVADLILNRIKSENKSKVTILGWLEKADDVFKHLADAHVCCYPSHMEGFGIAPVEAMALGKPVIFMKDGPGPEVMEHGISGFLVDTRSAQEIANIIIQIFDNQYDLGTICENARERSLSLFNLENSFIPLNVKYYENIMKEKQ